MNHIDLKTSNSYQSWAIYLTLVFFVINRRIDPKAYIKPFPIPVSEVRIQVVLFYYTTYVNSLGVLFLRPLFEKGRVKSRKTRARFMDS